MVERWGRGIEKILLAEPNTKFIEIGRQFKAVFPRKVALDLGSQKSSQKSSQKIIDAIKENPEVTIKELADMLRISDRAVKKNIAILKKKGIIRRVGPDKGGHWEII